MSTIKQYIIRNVFIVAGGIYAIIDVMCDSKGLETMRYIHLSIISRFTALLIVKY